MAKFSPAKVTYPGKKQVYRSSDSLGRYAGDRIGLIGENYSGSESLLVPVMNKGKRIVPRTDLADARKRCSDQLARLPEPLHNLSEAAAPYPVRHSERLENALAEVRQRLAAAARI